MHEENDAAEFHIDARSEERGRDEYEQILYNEWPDGPIWGLLSRQDSL